MSAKLHVIPSGESSRGHSFDLDQAFRQHAPYVARVVLRVLGRRDEVEDIVQQTFIAAMSGLKNLRNEEALRAWLATVAVRLARRKLRFRTWKRWVRLDDAPDYADVVDERCSPQDRLMVAHLYEVLDTLPAEQRLAWTLQHMEGERLERIAAICECSLATVKRRIASAHSVLEKVVHGH